MPPFLPRILREPLVHFLLLGAALFGLHALVARRDPSSSKRIALTQADVKRLREEHFRLVGRMPSAEEEDAIVERFIDDEVLYREGLALGLDRADLIVRGRVAQKMKFLSEDLTPLPEPTDAELEAYLSRSTAFLEPGRISFRQVFVSRDRHGESIEADAIEILAALKEGGASEQRAIAASDPFLIGASFRRKSEPEIDAVFGAGFSAQLRGVPAGAWSSPLRSSYGLHLVRVDETLAGRKPALLEVKEAVRKALISERRQISNREILDRMRAKYRIEGAPKRSAGTIPAALPAAPAAQEEDED